MKLSDVQIGLAVRFKENFDPIMSGIIVSKARRLREHYIINVKFCDNMREEVPINMMTKYKVGDHNGRT